MSDTAWMEAPPELMTRRQWAWLSQEQRDWRDARNRVRVAYLQAIHERRYSQPAGRRLQLHMELLEHRRR